MTPMSGPVIEVTPSEVHVDICIRPRGSPPLIGSLFGRGVASRPRRPESWLGPLAGACVSDWAPLAGLEHGGRRLHHANFARRHLHHIWLPPCSQLGSKLPIIAGTAVGHCSAMGESVATGLVDPLEGDPPLIPESGGERNARLLTPFGILDPRPWQVEVDPEALADRLSKEVASREQIDGIDQRLTVSPPPVRPQYWRWTPRLFVPFLRSGRSSMTRRPTDL